MTKKINNYLENPVFICGHRRSGTSLMLSLLDDNADFICFPAETGFFYAIYPLCFEEKNKKYLLKQISTFPLKNLYDQVNISLKKSDNAKLIFPYSELQKEIVSRCKATKDLTPANLLKIFMEIFYEYYKYPSTPRGWIEKSTSSEIYALEMFKWFPNAKFIHVIRDPRDNWASLKSGWHRRFRNYNDNISRLMHSLIERGRLGLELALHNLSLLGSKRYIVVRYEDLVGTPKKTMRRVTKFLKTKYNKGFITPTCAGLSWLGNNYSGKKFAKIVNRKKNNWIKNNSNEENALIEFYFHDLMQEFKYKCVTTQREQVVAAANHYKWHNYAQLYSFKISKK